MKKREIHWSNAVTTTSGEVTLQHPVEKKQLIMTSGSLPLPTKAERKKAKKNVVFVRAQGITTTAANISLREIKREQSIPHFVLSAEPGSAWKMAYNKRARTKHVVHCIWPFPGKNMQYVQLSDKDFSKNSIYFFVKRVGSQSVFMTMSGKLFSFALEDKSIKNLIERAF